MNPYTAIAANIMFPLHERLKGHSTTRVFHELERSQWFSVDELERLRIGRLRDFLTRIGQEVPYYRELFHTLNFDPNTVSSINDLQRLPLLDKHAIRSNIEKMKSDSASTLQRFNTGGSSGEPLIFYLGKERISHDVAAKRRATRWWGVDIGDPEIVLWGSPIELGTQDRLKQFRDRLFRTHLLSAFEMSRDKLDDFIDVIRRVKPRMLFGYPSSLAHLAEHALAVDIPLDNLGIKVAFVTSERLYDHQREKIEEVFGCPVANGYGGRDAGFIAHECPSGSLHLSAEDIIVEILSDTGEVLPPGEAGEIAVTHMATGDFPFIRYRTGDVGIIGSIPCSCGRGLPVLQEVQGRTTDFVVAQDGTVMHGLALIYIMRDLAGVKSFRIVQQSLSEISVEIVKGPGYQSSFEDNIRTAFRQRLGESVKVQLAYSSEISKEKSGKFRYIVSHVDPQQFK